MTAAQYRNEVDNQQFQHHSPYQPDQADEHVPAKSVEELLLEVEALQEPIQSSKADLEPLIVKMEADYFNRHDLGDILGASERFLLPLSQLCLKLAMLSHRNYDIGFSTKLNPVHVGNHMFQVELTKSKKRQAEDLEVLTEAVKQRYEAACKEDEVTRQDKLAAARTALKEAVEAEKAYQSRIAEALVNL